MLILMKLKQMKKNHDKIAKYGNFTIINSTTSPKAHDWHNVASDVVTGSRGTYSSGLDTLAFQPSNSMYDETVPMNRRESLKMNFLMNQDFQNLFMSIIATQLQEPKKNFYIVLENECYDTIGSDMMERFAEILGTDNLDGIVYMWNDTQGMKKYLEKICEKKVGKSARKRDFDIDDFDSIEEYFEGSNKKRKKSPWEEDTLEDDAYDEYLDWIDVQKELEDAEESKDVRKLFLKNIELAKGKKKFLTNAVAKYDARMSSKDD